MYLCKKMNMDKKEYYIRMHSNLQYVKKNNCNGDYLCPICLNEYSEQDVKNVLTEEDVPQKSLGGNRDVQPAVSNEDEWYRYGRSQAITSLNNRDKIIVGVNRKKDNPQSTNPLRQASPKQHPM